MNSWFFSPPNYSSHNPPHFSKWQLHSTRCLVKNLAIIINFVLPYSISNLLANPDSSTFKIIQKIATLLFPATTTPQLDYCSGLLTGLSVSTLVSCPPTLPLLHTAAHNPTHKPSHITFCSELWIGSYMVQDKSQMTTVTCKALYNRAPTASLASEPRTLTHVHWPPFCSQTLPPCVFLFWNVLLPSSLLFQSALLPGGI